MPNFRLSPIPASLGNEAWKSSPVRSECWVNAADEAEARSMASGRFQDAAATVPGEQITASPWRDAQLVEVTQDEETKAMSIPYGTVVSGPQM